MGDEEKPKRYIDTWKLQYHRWVRYPDESEPVIEKLVERVTVEGKPRWLEIKPSELYRTTVIKVFHLADGTDTETVPGPEVDIEYVKTESGSMYYLGEPAPKDEPKEEDDEEEEEEEKKEEEKKEEEKEEEKKEEEKEEEEEEKKEEEKKEEEKKEEEEEKKEEEEEEEEEKKDE